MGYLGAKYVPVLIGGWKIANAINASSTNEFYIFVCSFAQQSRGDVGF